MEGKFESHPNNYGSRDLCQCPDCTSNFVQPVDWEEASKDTWEVNLWCPECEWTDTSIYTESEVMAYDKKLDEGTNVLVEILREIVRSQI